MTTRAAHAETVIQELQALEAAAMEMIAGADAEQRVAPLYEFVVLNLQKRIKTLEAGAAVRHEASTEGAIRDGYTLRLIDGRVVEVPVNEAGADRLHPHEDGADQARLAPASAVAPEKLTHAPTTEPSTTEEKCPNCGQEAWMPGACSSCDFTDAVRAKVRQQAEAAASTTARRLIGCFDAAEWAKAFMEIDHEYGIHVDEGTMLGWFANAIMAGYDHAKREVVTHAPTTEAGSDRPAGSLPNTPNQAGPSEPDGFKATQQALSPEEIELTKMVRAALAGAPPFRPYAYFDEQLDCIRIGWRDTSVTESRLSPALTVMLANYDANGEPATEAEIVGVVMKGVAHACATARVGADIPHQIATKIDALLAVTEAK